MQSQTFKSSNNKLYTKFSNSDAWLWNDAATDAHEVLKYEINKALTTILGYKCDELVLTCKSEIQKYYFNSELSVDSKVFEKHKYGNWYYFLSKSSGLPLRSKIENDQFVLETTATEVKAMKLENAFFEIPANAQTMKTPD
ncbi:MAG: hypothetical protein JWQ40_207 [Segetibacter sp.]|nr:hypothetical protein [Segetibacter sp.]